MIIIRRCLILAFFFIIGGALGAGGFYLWASGAAFSHHRRVRVWVNSLSYEDLRHWMRMAFVAGGAISALSIAVLIVQSDRDEDESE